MNDSKAAGLSLATGAALPEGGVLLHFLRSFIGGLLVGALLGSGAALLPFKYPARS